MNDARRGIVHVIGPEQGLTLPGMTIVCGDSHTSTHGAFGALAFGIGTSEVEHVLATQTLIQKPAKNMRVGVEGSLPLGVTAKDVILAIIGKLGTAGGTGYVIEYAGRTIREMTMEGRMTVCNMSIEAGARAGLIAPGRDDLPVSRRPALRAQGRRLGPGARPVAAPAERQGRQLRQPARPAGLRHPADGHLGHQPAGRAADHRRGCPIRPMRRTRTAARRGHARSPTWA